MNSGVTVPLNECALYKVNGAEYNETCHGLIVCGRDINDGIELYDINKDKWNIITDGLTLSAHDMFIAEENPYIVYVLGYITYPFDDGVDLQQIDLRDGNVMSIFENDHIFRECIDFVNRKIYWIYKRCWCAMCVVLCRDMIVS